MKITKIDEKFIEIYNRGLFRDHGGAINYQKLVSNEKNEGKRIRTMADDQVKRRRRYNFTKIT